MHGLLVDGSIFASSYGSRLGDSVGFLMVFLTSLLGEAIQVHALKIKNQSLFSCHKKCPVKLTNSAAGIFVLSDS